MGIFTSKAPPQLALMLFTGGSHPNTDLDIYPYRIVEIIHTIDGPLFHLTDKKFTGRKEAEEYIARESQEW